MTNTLLWETYAQLDKAEMRLFDKFVRSPFFNGKTYLSGLNDYLRQCKEKSISPTNEGAYSATTPSAKALDLVKLRLAASDLLALLNQFLAHQETHADQVQQKVATAKVLRRKGLEKQFNTHIREAERQNSHRPWRHADHYEAQYHIEWERFQMAASQKRYDTFNLQAINDLMDQTYLARKLRLVCLSLSHQTVTGQQYDFGLYAPTLSLIEQKNWHTIPAIGLYFHACQFLGRNESSDDAHFAAFRHLLTVTAKALPLEEQRTLYLLALNYCIKKTNTQANKAAWMRQTWELYREALDTDALLEQGQLSRFAFNNVVSIAVQLNEVAWATAFIQSHIGSVEPKFRLAVQHLSLAKVAFAQRQFDRALQLLQGADYRDLISGMHARILQLKIYYETDAYDLLESHLDSIKTYLRRHKATGYHRDTYIELVRFVRALIRCAPGDTAAIAELRRSIMDKPTLLEKEWLLEQLG